MRGLRFDGPGSVSFHPDLDEPRLLDDADAIIRVTAAGLCGSDLHPYRGAEAARPGVVPGHEAVGVVEAVGDTVRTVAVGDRVAVAFTTSCGTCTPCTAGLSSRCVSSRLFGWGDPDDADAPALHGAQAELLLVPHADGTLVALPEGIDDATGVLLADNLPTGYYAAQRAEIAPGSGDVLVVGLGAVGRCAALAARCLGAERVLVTDADPARLAAAAEVMDVVPVTVEATGDLRCHAVIEAAGPPAAQTLAAAAVAPGGVLSLISVQTASHFAFSPVLAYDRNLTIRAGRAPVRSLLPEVLQHVRDGNLEIPPGAVVTHPARPLEEGPALYAAFAGHADDIVKATFDPTG